MNDRKALKMFKDKADSKSYILSGDLTVNNSNNVYKYDVSVFYKNNMYRVKLLNKDTNYSQIILKNNKGVYIVTPSLNKSFKFQSNWPYNNSEVYLLKSLLSDIEGDDNRKFKKEKNMYSFSTSVNYPSNRHLVRQSIIFDKKMNAKRVNVYDDNGSIVINMIFNKIKYNKYIANSNFKLDNNLSIKETFESSSEVQSVYPLDIPSGTHLSNEDKSEDGKSVIMTFDGDKPFTLVEEVLEVSPKETVIPTFGEPVYLQDGYGTVSDNSVYFTSGKNSYYLVSDSLNKDELVSVASSINAVPTMK